MFGTEAGRDVLAHSLSESRHARAATSQWNIKIAEAAECLPVQHFTQKKSTTSEIKKIRIGTADCADGYQIRTTAGAVDCSPLSLVSLGQHRPHYVLSSAMPFISCLLGPYCFT